MSSATAEKNLVLMSQDEVMERLVLPQGLKATPIKVGTRPRIIKDGEGYVVQLNRKDYMPLNTVEGRDSLMAFAGIPKGLSSGTPEKLIMPVLEHQLAKLDRVVAISDDANGLLRLQKAEDLAPVLEPAQVLEHLYQQFPEVLYQRAERGENYGFDLLAITHNQVNRLEELVQPGQHKFLPRGGDPFRAGVHLRFSPIGTVAPLIEPYVVRLMCTNGMVAAQFLNGWGKGYGDGNELWAWFQEGMAQAGQSIGVIMGQYASLVGEALPDGEGRMLAIEGAIRETRLTRELADTARGMAIANPPQTHYDLLNILTSVATHHTKTFGEQLRRMGDAGRMADPANHTQYCRTCHRN